MYQPVAAGSTVTVSQQGNDNTAAAEQAGVASHAEVVARITQIGNNNHVGGPGGTTGGILQYEPGQGAISNVTQTGTGNNAGIVQRAVGPLAPFVDVTQTGNTNSATVRQENSSGTDITVKQNGNGNVTNVEQSAADSGILVAQNGINNSATAVQRLTGLFFGPAIEQNGEGNTVSGTAINVSFSEHNIVQTGLRNNAITYQANTTDSTLSIRQLGADNRADINQAGDNPSGTSNQSATINQNGNNNLASIVQAGLTGPAPIVGNTALIAQVGNSNNATVRQVGGGFASSVSQIGSGNYANTYQH